MNYRKEGNDAFKRDDQGSSVDEGMTLKSTARPKVFIYQDLNFPLFIINQRHKWNSARTDAEVAHKPFWRSKGEARDALIGG